MMNTEKKIAPTALPTNDERPIQSQDPHCSSLETITVPKANWDKLMDMLERLNVSQAELNRNQAELIKQLALANERIKELEVQKHTKQTASPCQDTSKPTLRAQGEELSSTAAAGNPKGLESTSGFTYKVP